MTTPIYVSTGASIIHVPWYIAVFISVGMMSLPITLLRLPAERLLDFITLGTKWRLKPLEIRKEYLRMVFWYRLFSAVMLVLLGLFTVVVFVEGVWGR